MRVVHYDVAAQASYTLVFAANDNQYRPIAVILYNNVFESHTAKIVPTERVSESCDRKRTVAEV